MKAVLTPEEAKSFYADVNAEIKRAKSFSKTFKYQFKNEELIEPSESDFKFFTEEIGFRPITSMAEQSTGFRGLEVEFNELLSEIQSANNSFQNLENKKEEYSDLSSKIKEIQDTRTLPIPRRKEKIEELKQEKKKFDKEYPSVKKDLIKSLKKTTQLNKIIKKNLDERIEGFTDYLTESKEEIEEVDADKIRSFFTENKTVDNTFKDKYKAKHMYFYPSGNDTLFDSISKLKQVLTSGESKKTVDALLNYLNSDGSSNLDISSPNKNFREEGFAEIVSLLNIIKQSVDSLNEDSDDEELIKIRNEVFKTLYDSTGVTKNQEDIADKKQPKVKKGIIAFSKNIVKQLERYDKSLENKNISTNLNDLLGGDRYKNLTMGFLNVIHDDENAILRYDITGSVGGGNAKVGPFQPPKVSKLMDDEGTDLQGPSSLKQYTKNYLGYAELLSLGKKINRLTNKDYIGNLKNYTAESVKAYEPYQKTKQATELLREKLGELSDSILDSGDGISDEDATRYAELEDKVSEAEKKLEEAKAKWEKNSKDLSPKKRGNSLLQIIIADSKKKGRVIIIDQERTKAIREKRKKQSEYITRKFLESKERKDSDGETPIARPERTTSKEKRAKLFQIRIDEKDTKLDGSPVGTVEEQEALYQKNKESEEE